MVHIHIMYCVEIHMKSAASEFTHCVSFAADCSSGAAHYVNPEVCVQEMDWS